MWYRNFLKKLLIFDVLFGKNKRTLTDGSDASHLHYHNYDSIVTATLEINNIVQNNGYVGNVIDTVVVDNDGDVVYYV